MKYALLVVIAVLGVPLGAAAQEWTPEGRALTDRSIELSVIVEAPPDTVYRLWTTPEGIRRFMGVDAVVDGHAGGRYEVYFLPRSHPESEANSTHGAKLLRTVPDSLVAFEWATTPLAPELAADPAPLWVEVTMWPLDPGAKRTVVRLVAHGFGRGNSWDRVYEFDVTGWGAMLYALDRVVVDPSYRPGWLSGGG